MSSGNRYAKHVILFPEDRLCSDIAQGFVEADCVDDSRCWVHHNYGTGWSSVVEGVDDFDLGRFKDSHLVLVIDFDRAGNDRYEEIRRRLSSNPYKDRIYIIGASNEADNLKKEVAEILHKKAAAPKDVGRVLAESSASSDRCDSGIWSMSQLSHNMPELSRLCDAVRDVIFV